MKKVLMVIPAYNEEKNIGKVIKEIKKDFKEADILVINDYSNDNTEQVLIKNKVNYLNNIYNMGYAKAVQTGIKYAHDNNYDYVIQFDADGQHIATEAKKLVNAIKNSGNDIIIGSRYLKDLGYPCPFFRRVGTKIFEFIIKLTCKTKIVDPLSGFQCFNKKIIEKYSRIDGYPEYPDANLIIEMLKSGYKIKEVPVKMRIRENGESMHGGIIKPIKYMINMIYEIFFILIQYSFKRGGNK